MCEDVFGAAQDDSVVGGWELQVVVPDVAAPVLGACVVEEWGGCAEGAEGGDGWEDEVFVFGKKMGGPCVL